VIARRRARASAARREDSGARAEVASLLEARDPAGRD